jgi:FKBP-type peptidyl-prolyl cis-trans isomerase FklB
MTSRSRWTVVVAAGFLAIAGIALYGVRARAQATPGLGNQKDRLSYGLGVAMARTFQRQGTEVDVEVMARGMRDALSGGKLLLPEKDLRAALSALQRELKQRRAEAARRVADASKTAAPPAAGAKTAAVTPPAKAGGN